MTTEKTERAEHVSGIVLQPLWRIHKIDWTVRKNVFEKSCLPAAYGNTNSSSSSIGGLGSLTTAPIITDDRTCRETRHAASTGNTGCFIRGENSYRDVQCPLQRDFSGRGRERSTFLHRYRPSYNRKRWNCDIIRKPPTP